MFSREKKKLKMYNSIILVCLEFIAALQTVPKLAEFFEMFKNKVAEIEKFAKIFSTVSKGTTDHKNSARAALEKDLFLNCRTLAVLARQLKDLEMTALVDLAESDVGKLTDDDVSDKAEIVYNFMEANKSVLGAYGKTEQNISEFRALIDSYDDSSDNKGTKTTASVVARKNLRKAFTEADRILLDMDDLVLNFQKTNLEFYNNYFQDRLKKISGVRHEGSDCKPDTKDADNNSGKDSKKNASENSSPAQAPTEPATATA